jgi:hypothetical protein
MQRARGEEQVRAGRHGFLLLVVALLVVTLSASVADASPRKMRSHYIGPSIGSVLACSDAAGIGGACFDLENSERSVTIRVLDESGLRVGGWYRFLHSQGPNAESFVAFCDTTAMVPVPIVRSEWDRVQLQISLDVMYGSAACGAPSLAIRGMILASLWS